MPVVLTQEVEGLNVGDTYTGDDEAWLLASGYARRDADPGADPAVEAYDGPGVSNTGPADVAIADNREFDDERGQIAATSDLPFGATNDGIELKDAEDPTVAYTGQP